MFQATERLPHVLPPAAYSSEQQFARESQTIFQRAWHFVGLQSELARSGDFITTELCGWPLQIRNFAGQLHAVSNVCAHRHCLISGLRRGNSEKLTCQYHGWEYDATGVTRRIPQAQNFGPLDRDATRIPVFRVETAGPLVFVNLTADAPDLQSSLGQTYKPLLQGTSSDWMLIQQREFPQPVNWKIPVENSLEAYHVPWIHAETFRDDPGESRSIHQFDESGSTFETTLPFSAHSKADALFQRLEGWALRVIAGEPPTCRYRQHLVFPNLLFSFTDMMTLVHVVRPTGPQTCTSMVCQFGRRGANLVSRPLARVWGHMVSSIVQAILMEDFRLFPDIQQGLNGSRQPGMLGRCEERLHHFQQWLVSQSGEAQIRPNGVADVVANCRCSVEDESSSAGNGAPL